MGVISPRRDSGHKGLFRKWRFDYDPINDYYVCPNGCILSYQGTNRDGSQAYISNPEDCRKCPLRDKCTASKKCQRIVHRHVWQDYRDEIDRNRKSFCGREIFKGRKETIERRLRQREATTRISIRKIQRIGESERTSLHDRYCPKREKAGQQSFFVFFSLGAYTASDAQFQPENRKIEPLYYDYKCTRCRRPCLVNSLRHPCLHLFSLGYTDVHVCISHTWVPRRPRLHLFSLWYAGTLACIFFSGNADVCRFHEVIT